MFKFSTFSKDFHLLLSSLSNHRLQVIPPGGMVSKPDVCRSGLVPQTVGDDLHVVVPDDANAAVVTAQVDANRPSRLQLDLDLVGDLVELIIRETDQKIINKLPFPPSSSLGDHRAGSRHNLC